MNEKGQDDLEYLLLFAGAILVAVIVVTIITGLSNPPEFVEEWVCSSEKTVGWTYTEDYIQVFNDFDDFEWICVGTNGGCVGWKTPVTECVEWIFTKTKVIE